MGRKIYVVVKLCVEFPSPENGEMQMHVESSLKTTLQVDTNKQDDERNPFTYSKFTWPGEKFEFTNVSTSQHQLLLEVWQARLLARDKFVGAILIPLTCFKFTRAPGNNHHLTSYVLLACNPAQRICEIFK
jgi:hypothetical protein